MQKTLLEITQALLPEQSRTTTYYPFMVGAGCEALRIRFSYAPKALADEAAADAIIDEGFQRYVLPEDRAALNSLRREVKPLVNLVTLSLDAPDGYRGAAHRHDPEQEHVVRAADSSYGFADGPMLPGAWRVGVSAHAVITRPCTVRLTVEEERR